MSRKAFIESHGATCRNWQWSWSFVNKSEKFVIFGAWNFHTSGNKALIFGEDWQILNGRKQPGYKQSREHLRLVEEEGYRLMTFAMQGSDANSTGPAKVKNFTPELEEKVLKREGGNWYAV